MAIPVLRAQFFSRGSGDSAVAAAAYRSGEKIYDERQGMSPKEADTRLAKEFPNTYPFFKEFLELRHDAAEKIRYNSCSRFDVPQHMVAKIQSIMRERESTPLDATEQVHER